VQPGEAAFNDPTDLAQPGAVRDTAARDPWNDATLAQQPPVLVEVVAAVGVRARGACAGAVRGSRGSVEPRRAAAAAG
jgi:hypothetical protein